MTRSAAQFSATSQGSPSVVFLTFIPDSPDAPLYLKHDAKKFAMIKTAFIHSCCCDAVNHAFFVNLLFACAANWLVVGIA